MKASIDGTVVADAADSALISIEGNYYFPPSSLVAEVFSDSSTAYHCPWKGDAHYRDVSAGGSTLHDAAWSYDDLMPSALERVGSDFNGYVAFDAAQVTVA